MNGPDCESPVKEVLGDVDLVQPLIRIANVSQDRSLKKHYKQSDPTLLHIHVKILLIFPDNIHSSLSPPESWPFYLWLVTDF